MSKGENCKLFITNYPVLDPGAISIQLYLEPLNLCASLSKDQILLG